LKSKSALTTELHGVNTELHGFKFLYNLCKSAKSAGKKLNTKDTKGPISLAPCVVCRVPCTLRRASRLMHRSPCQLRSLSSSVTALNTRHGLPAATTLAGISFVTTLPEPITELSPIVTPGFMTTFPPIQTLFPIRTG